MDVLALHCSDSVKKLKKRTSFIRTLEVCHESTSYDCGEDRHRPARTDENKPANTSIRKKQCYYATAVMIIALLVWSIGKCRRSAVRDRHRFAVTNTVRPAAI
ncbi:hypothetical protein CC2G_014129 [Coprinopsis cinerea AmutBmut pab1-1]|nr:hypothetical protein CC2G_014129 [Coprinopsis cinerea AmutBmut pab1-1]